MDTNTIEQTAAPVCDFILGSGAHQPDDEQNFCLLERSARLAGRPHSDRDPLASPVCAGLGRALNDTIRDTQIRTAKLARFATRLVPSRGSNDLEIKRELAALDWLVRDYAPRYYEVVEALKPHAQHLRNLPELTGPESAEVALKALRAAQDEGERLWLEKSDGLSAGLSAGLSDGLSDGLRDGLRAGLRDGLRAGLSAGLRDGLRDGLSAGLRDGLRAGLSDGLSDGLRDGLSAGLSDGLSAKLKTAQTYNDAWSIGYYGTRNLEIPGKPELIERLKAIGTEVEDSAVSLLDRLLSMK